MQDPRGCEGQQAPSAGQWHPVCYVGVCGPPRVGRDIQNTRPWRSWYVQCWHRVVHRSRLKGNGPNLDVPPRALEACRRCVGVGWVAQQASVGGGVCWGEGDTASRRGRVVKVPPLFGMADSWGLQVSKAALLPAAVAVGVCIQGHAVEGANLLWWERTWAPSIGPLGCWMAQRGVRPSSGKIRPLPGPFGARVPPCWVVSEPRAVILACGMGC